MPFLKGDCSQIRKEYIGIGVVVSSIVAAAFVMGLKVGFTIALNPPA